MTRAAKISAYILAFVSLGLAAYSLVGIARDVSGEQCYGFYGTTESCLSVMMIPVQLMWPFMLPIVLLLALLVSVPLLRKKMKR